MSEMLDLSPDKQLIERCRNGDLRVWQGLFQEYHPRLVQVIRHALSKYPVPDCDLEEMASTCLSRFWLAISTGLSSETEEIVIGDYLTETARHEAWRWVVRRRK